ncbi:MAG: muconolactone Delta-isomerase, partial [Candidatus Dormibacteria bacterium]
QLACPSVTSRRRFCPPQRVIENPETADRIPPKRVIGFLRNPQSGVIRRLWRVPGRRANWGVWEARDATALHGFLTSLPMYPWLSIAVHPLAAHPSDPEPPEVAHT